ncbi:MAG TPA: ArdC-like ssDNA-binding domain-containing protein [Nitrolancea sp.]|nr:ArdC-like ssDNA-binding domain-containing protein [Nitrolancea sp.]
MERNRYQGEDPRERVNAALSTLEQGIDGILESPSFGDYLATMAKFHQYSSSNILLIHLQNPEASQVAGYQRWKQLGRQVKLGEKGIRILVPHIRKQTDDETDEEERSVRSFGLGTVFDIAQTEGKPLPEPPVAQEIRESSDAGMALFGHLLQFVEGAGITVTREELEHGHGYYAPTKRRIALGSHLAGDQRTKTLAHEAAHFVADHRGWINREDAETVAESVAFVVLNHYGIDASSYTFTYVAIWAQNRSVFKRNLDAIQRTAHALIAGVEGGDAMENKRP